MANRGRGSRGGGRGRGRGIVTVREAAYSLPVPEPCNFMEVSLRKTYDNIVGGQAIAFTDIARAIAFSLGGTIVLQWKKMRVTSMVVEPANVFLVPTSPSASSNVAPLVSTPDFVGQKSGNHFAAGDTQKPLRIRFSKQQGSDGEWIKNFSASGNPSSGAMTIGGLDGYGRDISVGNGGFDDPRIFGTLDFDVQDIAAGNFGRASANVDIRFRIAYQDGSNNF